MDWRRRRVLLCGPATSVAAKAESGPGSAAPTSAARLGPLGRMVVESRPGGVDGVQPAHTELEIYFADVADHLITRVMGSDGDDATLDRRRV